MSASLKKKIWITIALLVSGYSINSYMVTKSIKDAMVAVRYIKEQAIKSSIADMVSRNAALDNWEQRLSNKERYRLEPILTVELEKLWLQSKPILFVGVIKDIVTYNETLYTVTIEKSVFSSSEYDFSTDIQLSLLASKHQIDDLLEQNPDLFNGNGFDKIIAVVTQVKNIESKTIMGAEGVNQELKTGVGELIDARIQL